MYDIYGMCLFCLSDAQSKNLTHDVNESDLLNRQTVQEIGFFLGGVVVVGGVSTLVFIEIMR